MSHSLAVGAGRPLTRQAGLTLIELMIVIAIIALLATLGTSLLRSYIMQARVATGISVAQAMKTRMTEAIMLGDGDLPFVEPLFNPSAGISCIAPWVYRSSRNAACDSVHIDVVFDPDWVPSTEGGVTDSRIVIQGHGSGALIKWQCGAHYSSAHTLKEDAYYPSGCRTEASRDAGRFSCMRGEPERKARACTHQ